MKRSLYLLGRNDCYQASTLVGDMVIGEVAINCKPHGYINCKS